jgi:putative hydrolase of the HAD superfamily
VSCPTCALLEPFGVTEPRFLYFDLGKVLVDFEVEQMLQQVGRVAGIDPARVDKVLAGDGLQREYELGRVSSEQFYERFCEATGTRPDYDALERAASDIFEVNVSILPLVACLERAGYRLGILSNTCRSHWEHCRRKFRIVAESFSVYALSYEIHAMKPDAAIFRSAAELAGVAPEEIFFTDDTPGHVAGARAAGFDAVQYVSTPELAAELRSRGVRLSY